MRKISTLFIMLALVVILALSMGLVIAAAQVNPSQPNLQETEEPDVTDVPDFVTVEPTFVVTEDPGLTVTEDPNLTATEESGVPAVPQNLAYLRLAHFALDAPSVEILIDGEPSHIQALNPGAITGWVEMLAGEYQITLAPVGAGTDVPVLGPISYVLSPQTWTTIAVVGSAEAGTVTAQVIREDLTAIDENSARVTVLHTLENGPAVDVVRADGTVLASNIAYAGTSTATNSGSATFEVPSGPVGLQIVPTGEVGGTPLLDLTTLELQGGTFYFIAITGTADAPRAQVESIKLTTLQEATNAEFPPASTTEEPSLDVTEEPGLVVTEEPGLTVTEGPGLEVTEEAGTG
jgi:hypothetical protein